MKPELNYYFIHGVNGSGKDTQALELASVLPYSEAISTGNVFRGALKPDGEYGRFYHLLSPYESQIAAGSLLPDKAILAVVEEFNKEQILRGIDDFIYSGFPRTLTQLLIMDDKLAKMRELQPVTDKHILLQLSEEEAMRRSEKRRQIAEEKGEEPRPDDKPEVISRRFGIFKAETMPMIDSLREQKRLLIVDASGTISEVKTNVLKVLF